MSPRKKKARASSERRKSDSPQERLRQAEELVTQALDSIDESEQRRLAREAARLAPDCSSAWSLLGDLAPDARRALPHYEKAVAAIDREVGEARCRELEAGRAGIDDAHPWFLWRCDLAYALFNVGRIQDSINLLNILLRLAPEDDAGLRYLLARALLHDQRHEELDKLLLRYRSDQSCAWKFTRSLLLYRIQGDTDKSRTALIEAHKANIHVSDYLIGPEGLPDEVPDLTDPGTKAEAAEYVIAFLTEWEQTNGAITWLCDVLDEADPVGPADYLDDDYLDDDLLGDVLLGDDSLGDESDSDFVQMSQWDWKQLLPGVITLPAAQPPDWEIDLMRVALDDAEDAPEWVVAVVDGSSKLPLMLQPFDERPRDTEVFDVLLKAIFDPTTGRPARPTSIRMKRKGFFNAWQKRLEGVGIRCELVDELPAIDRTASLLLVGAKNLAARRQLGDADGDRLRALPRDDAMWVTLVRPLPTWVRADNRVIRPWVRLIVDATIPAIISSDMNDTKPSADWLKQGLAVSMLAPGSGDPRRPGTVCNDPSDYVDELSPWLESLEVDCSHVENPEGLDLLVEDFANNMTGPGRAPSLTKTRGMSTELVAALFGAAWTYYMSWPWERISERALLKVECDAWDSGPWYANVLGYDGTENALTLYEDREFAERLISGQLSRDETARQISSLALTFSTMYDLSPDDVDAAEANEWFVADPDAWPNVIRVNPGMSRRAALPWEVELLIASLLAISTAVTRGGVCTDWQEIETVGRKVRVRVSLVGEF
ncbi:MAG: DUF6930 domain-containing protein [Maioricimonas sp. JB049]